MVDRAPKFDAPPAVTIHASAALTGGRCCAVSGATVDGNIRVGKPAAKAKCFGVLSRDVASGDKGGCWAAPGMIIYIDNTNAAVTAGQSLEVDAEGLVRTFTDGVKVAEAVDDAAANTAVLAKWL